MINKFRASRRAGVPIVGIESVDPAATIETITKAYGDKAVPMMQWDIVRGLSPLSDQAERFIQDICKGDPPALVTGNPVEMLSRLVDAPPKSIIFMHQSNRLLESSDPGIGIPVSQGIWNLRDVFKTKNATLVLLGSILILPSVLKNDVMVIEEPLPTAPELKTIVETLSQEAGATITPEDSERHAKSLLGLSAFSAEQSFATSLYDNNGTITVDERGLWERKCKTAEQTRGLSIYRGKESFKDVIGYDNAKLFLRKIMDGPDPVEAYIFIDEIEKQMAGFGSDLSGVSGEMMGKMLTWMQMKESLGVLLLGPGGTGKSLVGLATGNEAKKPTVIFDLSAMKGSLVGQSIENLGAAQRMVDGLSGGGRIMIIGTCNRFGSLPPELKRRFSLGTFFFDLPTATERAGIWNYYQNRFSLKPEQITAVDDDGWTGAEIKNACNIAWRLNCTLSEASNYVVPVSRSAGDEIEKLRASAEGKFISASNTGFYKRSKSGISSDVRKITIKGE